MTYLLLLSRIFFSYDILFDVMTYFILFVFDVMRYSLTYVLTSWRNVLATGSILPIFCCYDAHFWLYDTFLTSWRTFHAFWHHDVYLDLMTHLTLWHILDILTYFLHCLMLWRTFWHHDVLFTSWHTVWRYDVFCDVMMESSDVMTYFMYIVDIMTYILTSWRNILPNDDSYDVMTYFLISWRPFNTFGLYDVLLDGKM